MTKIINPKHEGFYNQFRSKVAVHLIMKNETKHIRSNLSSMAGIANPGYLCITDTGSTDDSIDIALEFGAKVNHIEWRDDFGWARNESLIFAVKECPDAHWHVWWDLDDQLLNEDDIYKFRLILDEYLDNENVIAVNCPYIYSHSEGDLGNQCIPEFKYHRLRAFKTGTAQWSDVPIHEYIVSDQRRHVNRDEVIFHHFRDGNGKMNTDRNLRIFRKLIDKTTPENLPRMLFYFAKECVYNGLIDEAIENFKKYIPLSNWIPEKHRALFELASLYAAKEDYDLSTHYSFEAIKLDPNYADPYVQLARNAYNKKQWKKVILWCDAIGLLDGTTTNFFDYIPTKTWIPEDLKSIAYWNLDKSKGIDCVNKCLSYKPHEKRFLHNWFVFSRDLGKLTTTSIIIPTHSRKEKLINCIKSIKENIVIGESYYEILIGVDGNKNYYEELLKELPDVVPGMNVKIKLFENKSTVPYIVECLVDASTCDNICFLGDDTEPKMGFLIHALKTSNNENLVCFNDHVHEGRECQHWLAPKSLREKLGGEFFHVGYNHVGCDNELKIKCEKLGLFRFDKNAIVFHQHFIKDICSDKKRVAEKDECYSIGWDEENVKKDRDLLKLRISNNFISDDEKVYINVGAGSGSPKYSKTELSRYLSLDKFNKKANIRKDILEEGLFNNNSVDEFLMEHVLEHFSSKDGDSVVKVMFNALKEGGKLEISVPDIGRIGEVTDIEYRLKVVYGWRVLGDGMFHLFGYSNTSIKDLLVKNGFVIESIEQTFEYDAPAIRVIAVKPKSN